MAYRLTRKAEADLTEIYLSGVANFGVTQAEDYLAGLLKTFDLLADNPLLARLRQQFKPAVRIHPHSAHAIIYREIEADILVIRIRHGRENWLSVGD